MTKDEKKVDASELKAGLSVVVDARGDSIDKLTVRAVKIAPPAASSK